MFTCQVFILTPFVVPISLALLTKTSETMASDFPFPKLPMLDGDEVKKSNKHTKNKDKIKFACAKNIKSNGFESRKVLVEMVK